MHRMRRALFESYVRNFIFGVEDSLVSTVGLVSGIALAGVASRTVILTGLVLIIVEAFSMAAGSFLSERSGEEFVMQKSVPPMHAIIASLIMFFSYLVSGLIPLAPYVLIEAEGVATLVSVVVTLAALGALGVVASRLSHTASAYRAIQMVVVGGAAILLGVVVGTFVGI
ncbi:MAG: VIT1/CCC1 transporter family protein [Patescibacteria group bacterium]